MNQNPRSLAVQRYSGLIPAATFLSLSSLGILASAFFPSFVSELGCDCHNLLGGKIYTPLTYAFVHAGLIHLVSVGFSLLLSVYFLGEMLSRNEIWLLIGGSLLLGAGSFCLLMKQSGILIGGAMIAWGFVGSVMALAIIKWKSINFLRRAYSVVIALFTVPLVFTFLFSAMSFVQLSVAGTIFIAIYLRHRKRGAVSHDQTIDRESLPPTS